MRPIIKVKNLSKQYFIGGRQAQYATLSESLGNIIRSPLKLIKRSGQLSAETVWALKDASFEVMPGEVVGVIGRNGAGKSTLLKILSRITEPTTGEVDIYGRVGSLLEVGTGFHGELTGRENIYLNGAILGMKKREIDRRFDEIVAFSEVEKFIDTPVKYYSSGMYLRLAFAVAAHLDPEILIVDEVLAVGDVGFQKKCLGKMEDVSKNEGRTVLVVSHNMFSLQNLCNKAVLLESGRMVMEGETAAVINKYLESGEKLTGEISWDSPDVAPGDGRTHLKAVRVVCEDVVTGNVDITKDFRVEVDYWNFEPNVRRMVSIQLYNAMGICVLTSVNFPSASFIPDPWYSRLYPKGLFRTSCAIPGCFLNDGTYSITIHIHGGMTTDCVVVAKNILPFNVQDTGEMRGEYTGQWAGATRPRLHWETVELGC